MPQRPSSWFTIVAVVLAELAVALAIAYAVAQGYLSYECGDVEYRASHSEECAGGFPYPLF
jgi:hypothetical protein